jgi:monovalent cation/proton antiporter MnhG/PhaG subunit
LLRLPDVFTRMHAATKAATVGVIGTTAAAAAEAGAIGGVMILLLVVALLFLSGPLGMSLLARAAYHDPETPMWKNTRELPIELPIPESTPSRRSGGTSPYLGLWLFAIWVAAFGSVAPNVIVGGLIVAGLLALALRRLAPRWPRAVWHPVAVLRFAGHFVSQLVVSTWDVIKALRLSPEEIRPAIIEIPLRVRTRNEVALLMNSISFTPGTVALELHGRNLYVHVLTTDDPSAVVAEVEAMENAVMAAFGSTTPAADADGQP